MTAAASVPTCERIWCWYLVVVVAIAATADGAGMDGHRPLAFVGLHLGLLGVVALVAMWARSRGDDAARWPRALLALIGLPTVFTALCWLLPAVHPEPCEYTFLAIDRRWFGFDLGDLAARLDPLAVEVLQACYAFFYPLCVLAALGALAGAGARAFDRAVLQLTFGFLVSYLGYLLVPTLAPKVVLAFPDAVTGVLATSVLRTWIDAGEANPWDCFPSGHTMLTVTSLAILWRAHRRWFWWLLPAALGLIASTVLLRYHWGVDVVAGAALVWPTMSLCDWLWRRDGGSAALVTRA